MQDAWKMYMAEGVRMITENTAKYAGGPYITIKWADIINPKPVEIRTPEQVIHQIMTRLKATGGGGDS